MQNPQHTYHLTDRIIDLAYALNQQTDFREMTRLVAQKCITLLNADLALILMVNPRTRDTVKTIMRENVTKMSRKQLPRELLKEMKQMQKSFDESYLSKSLAESVMDMLSLWK